MSNLYERIGGKAIVELAVDRFYEKVLVDDRIKHLFEGVDMKRQSNHQKSFFTYAFGGAPNYDGNNMRVAHKRLVEQMGLNNDHFDAVIENLGNTLKELGVAEGLITEAAGIAESTRDDVLNHCQMSVAFLSPNCTI